METILETVVDVLVNYYMELQALAGLLLFSVTAKYSYMITENLREHPEYSLTKLFIDRRATLSFWVISISSLIMAFGMAFENIGRRNEGQVMIAIGLLSTVLLMLGIAYFSSLLYRITSQQMDE